MRRYSVGGRNAVPSAINEPYAALWNNSTTKTIYLVALDVGNSGAGDVQFRMQRTSTRGTPGSTVTPDIDNDVTRAITPPSGVLLDLADFTAVPTYQGPGYGQALIGQNNAVNMVFTIPIAIPQNTGFAVEALAVLLALDTRWTWNE